MLIAGVESGPDSDAHLTGPFFGISAAAKLPIKYFFRICLKTKIAQGYNMNFIREILERIKDLGKRLQTSPRSCGPRRWRPWCHRVRPRQWVSPRHRDAAIGVTYDVTFRGRTGGDGTCLMKELGHIVDLVVDNQPEVVGLVVRLDGGQWDFLAHVFCLLCLVAWILLRTCWVLKSDWGFRTEQLIFGALTRAGDSFWKSTRDVICVCPWKVVRNWSDHGASGSNLSREGINTIYVNKN